MVVCYEDTQITDSKHVKQMESFINFVRCMCSIILKRINLGENKQE